jgi:tagatose-1,6-bisphosphate aldolase non-catalytic subunit AgaZ/GatZ|tara:strand:+ start:271 stop:486 length:216 start_codon:yes stop_codon:yes gene_type:complete
MLIAFLLIVVVDGEVVTTEEMLFQDVYRCNRFANAVERGESASDRQPYKWQENISAYCVPKMVSKDTELFK